MREKRAQGVPVHPLFDILSYTRDPVQGSYNKLRNTLQDIIAITAPQQACSFLESVSGIDPTTPEAFIRVHDYFANLGSGVTEQSSGYYRPLANTPDPEVTIGKGGIGLVYQHVVAIINALMNIQWDLMEEHRVIPTTRDHAEKKIKNTVSATASLAQFLVLGPASFWACPQDHRKLPQWKSHMLVELGCVAIEEKMGQSPPEDPLWGAFGNTRAHILKTLVEMGFGGGKVVNWFDVLKIFHEKFSYSALAQVLLEDLVLVTDEEQETAEVVWAVPRAQTGAIVEMPPSPVASSSQTKL